MKEIEIVLIGIYKAIPYYQADEHLIYCSRNAGKQTIIYARKESLVSSSLFIDLLIFLLKEKDARIVIALLENDNLIKVMCEVRLLTTRTIIYVIK